jgi:hypothetical protein
MNLKDRGYLLIAGVIGLAVALDLALNDSKVSIFLVRKLFRLMEYVEFWR